VNGQVESDVVVVVKGNFVVGLLFLSGDGCALITINQSLEGSCSTANASIWGNREVIMAMTIVDRSSSLPACN
jgi:hypothetical protein